MCIRDRLVALGIINEKVGEGPCNCRKPDPSARHGCCHAKKQWWQRAESWEQALQPRGGPTEQNEQSNEKDGGENLLHWGGIYTGYGWSARKLDNTSGVIRGFGKLSRLLVSTILLEPH